MTLSPLTVDDDTIRHDINSDDVRRVYPDLPSTPVERLGFLKDCDRQAYERIRNQYPLLRPPNM